MTRPSPLFERSEETTGVSSVSRLRIPPAVSSWRSSVAPIAEPAREPLRHWSFPPRGRALLRARLPLACVAMAVPTAFIGWLDSINGAEFGLSLFYILPIAVGGWLFGTLVGGVTALQAAAWWAWTDVTEHVTHSHAASLWNGFTRAVICITIGVGAAVVRADRARLRELLAREAGLARTDALTGLQNMRAFSEHVSQDLARAQREGTALTLVYLDVDNFKRVNDSHGHAAGDALLVRIATMIRGCLRTGDHAARLGGDEFGVLLWGADAQAGRSVARRLAESVRVLGEAFPESGIGASAGVASLPLGECATEQLLREADEAMYRAKRLSKQLATEAAS